MKESINFLNLPQQTSKLYKVLQPSSSLQSLLKQIQTKPKKTQAGEAFIVYDDNRVPLQQHDLNHVPTQKELRIYQWRNQTLSPIVKVHHITFQSIKEGRRFYKGAIVFTDHIVKTFQQLAQLPLPGLLYLLKEAIQGFTEILNNFGKVVIKPEFCGIDVVGRCKVWINQDFSKNQNQKNIHSQFWAESQSQIVLKTRQLIRAIKALQNQQISRFFSSFNDFIKIQAQRRTLQSKGAIRFIEQFSQKNNVAISDFISPFFFQMKINKLNSDKGQSNQGLNNLKPKCQKKNHVPQFLLKNNRKQSAAHSFCKENEKNIQKKQNACVLNKTPVKQSNRNKFVNLERIALNIGQVCQNNSHKNYREFQNSKKFEQDRRKTFFPLERKSQSSDSCQNQHFAVNVRQVASAQNIFKSFRLNLRDYDQRENQVEYFKLFGNYKNQKSNIRQCFNKEDFERPNIMKSVNSSNVKRKAFTPIHTLHQNNSTISSARHQPKLRNRKISGLNDFNIEDSIGSCSDFANLKGSYRNQQKATFKRNTCGPKHRFNQQNFVEINQFNTGRDTHIDGVQYIEETDLICREPLKGKSQKNQQEKQLKKPNLISNQYNITVSAQEAEERCKSHNNVNESSKKSKHSMTSTAQYTINSRLGNTNRKNVFSSNQPGSLNWISNSNRSIQNHIGDFQVRMADSYLVSRMQDCRDTVKTNTFSTLASNISQSNHTRSYKQIYPPDYSPIQSFIDIQKNQQRFEFPLTRGKTDNTFQKFIICDNLNISFERDTSQPSLLQAYSQDKKNQDLHKPIILRQIKNIPTVQSGFIRMNLDDLKQGPKQGNAHQINTCRNPQTKCVQQVISGNAWQMNKKIQNLISKNAKREIVQSICQGDDFGIKRENGKESGLKILGKMGRQIESTIFSDED